MKLPSRNLTKFIGWVLPLALGWMLGSGCASSPPAKAFPAPPSEEVRVALGTIGLVRAGSLTNSSLQKPLGTGAATATGAGLGALWGLNAGAEAGRGGGDFGALAAIVVWSVAVPLGTVVGAVGGHMEGMPVKQRFQAEARLHKAVLETDVERLLQEDLLRLTREKTRESIVPLDSPPGESRPTSLSTNTAIDTILEVSVLNAGLSGGRGRSLPLAAFLQVRVRVVRARDGAQLYAHTWVPLSGSATFEQWAANEAWAMRQELPRMIPSLAESVVEELFLVYDPNRSGKRK